MAETSFYSHMQDFKHTGNKAHREVHRGCQNRLNRHTRYHRGDSPSYGSYGRGNDRGSITDAKHQTFEITLIHLLNIYTRPCQKTHLAGRRKHGILILRRHSVVSFLARLKICFGLRKQYFEMVEVWRCGHTYEHPLQCQWTFPAGGPIRDGVSHDNPPYSY